MKFGEINYTEIKNWCVITRTPLTGWEAEAMIRIKSAYEAMLTKAEKPDCPAPYATDERIAETVDDQFAKLWSAAG